MASHLVHGIDIQLIVVVHGNIGEDGGTCTLMELFTAESNLNSIYHRRGSSYKTFWAKLTAKAAKTKPKTSEMKIRPADFS